MMLTEEKPQARRADTGKTRITRNVTTHGLTPHTVLLPDEYPAEFQTFVNALLDSHDRFTAAETALVFDLVDFEWRLRRASRLEAKILSAAEPDLKALNILSLHQVRLKRQFSATLKELLEIQKRTREEHNFMLEAAETIARADNILQRPPTHDMYGFGFSFERLKAISEEFDGYRKAKDILAKCKDPELSRYANIQNMPEAA
jgi:hypothetical protein